MASFHKFSKVRMCSYIVVHCMHVWLKIPINTFNFTEDKWMIAISQDDVHGIELAILWYIPLGRQGGPHFDMVHCKWMIHFSTY